MGVGLWPYRQNEIASFADASARDGSMPSPGDGQAIFNRQLSAIEVYDATAAVWRAQGIDLRQRGIAPDWWWDSRRLGFADAGEITSWPSSGLQAAASFSPVAGETGPTMDRDGVWNGRAAAFNDNVMDLTDPGHALTELTAVVYLAVSSWGFHCPFAHWDSTTGKAWMFLLTSSNGARFYVSADGTNTAKEYRTADNVMTTGQLHALAMTFDGGTLTPYLDGAEVGVTKTTDDAAATLYDAAGASVPLSLGGRLNSGAPQSWLTGATILACGIWNRALTAAQLAQAHAVVMEAQA